MTVALAGSSIADYELGGVEVGKPIAPQTASVGVATSRFVRSEGQVIRHNMSWTLIIPAYLILIGSFFHWVFPNVMQTG